MDRVAGEYRLLHVEFHVQEREPGVLHGRLHQQPFGEAIAQCRRRQALLDVGFLAQELGVGEQHLHHAGAVDEVDDVRLGHRAADGAEAPPDRQVLEMEAQSDDFHDDGSYSAR